MSDATILYNLAPPPYLLVDAPVRERILETKRRSALGIPIERDDSIRAAERLSWDAQGTAKKHAHLGRFDDPPQPEAWQDGAFCLPLYSHSYWNVSARTVRFVSPGKPEQTVRFDDVIEITLTLDPSKPPITDDYTEYRATLAARLRTGETRPLTTLLRLNREVATDAQALANRLGEWSQTPVAVAPASPVPQPNAG